MGGSVTSPLALGDAANPLAASWGPWACTARLIAPAAEPASTRQIATTTHRGAVATSRPRRVRAVGGGAPSSVGIGYEPRWWPVPRPREGSYPIGQGSYPSGEAPAPDRPYGSIPGPLRVRP